MSWVKKVWVKLRPFKGPIVLYRMRHKWYRHPYVDPVFRGSLIQNKMPFVREFVTSRGFVWVRGEGWSSEILTKEEVLNRMRRIPERSLA